MARLLPEEPFGRVAPSVARVHRLVASLPDAYFAWSPMEGVEGGLPDFWIVEEKTNRSLFLSVSEATEDQARGPGLFEAAEPWESPQDAVSPRLRRARELVGSDGAPGAVLFPDIPSDLLPREIEGWARGGREICRPSAFGEWIASRLGPPLPPEVSRHLRSLFCPETLLHARHSMRRNPSEPRAPESLTWKQEEIVKTDLDPGTEGRIAAGEFGLLLVQGVAGSGKSLVLLHRAALLSRLRRDNRILVLACNKPLQVELRRRYRELSGGSGQAEILTFHGFCLKRWPGGSPPRILPGAARRAFLDEELAALGRTTLLRRHLDEELAWIYEHGFPDEESYAANPRRGRGFRMDAALRSAMWKASVSFRARCAAVSSADWSLLPLLFREALEAAPPETYDAILVDEVQFFAPVWFECVRRFLAPRGHLLLAADPTQGFLRKGASWKSIGLSVQGRSRRLERSHRSTRPVMELAWKAWLVRADPTESDIPVPRFDGMREGPAPRWVPFRDARSEHAWIAAQIEAFLAAGGDPRDVLVLADDWSETRSLREQLVERLGADRVADARDGTKERALRICQLNSATGLESPVVFLAGIHRIFEREGSPDLDAEGRHQARDEASRKFHMALTRAGWRLVLTASGPLPTEIVTLLDALPG